MPLNIHVRFKSNPATLKVKREIRKSAKGNLRERERKKQTRRDRTGETDYTRKEKRETRKAQKKERESLKQYRDLKSRWT